MNSAWRDERLGHMRRMPLLVGLALIQLNAAPAVAQQNVPPTPQPSLRAPSAPTGRTGSGPKPTHPVLDTVFPPVRTTFGYKPARSPSELLLAQAAADRQSAGSLRVTGRDSGTLELNGWRERP